MLLSLRPPERSSGRPGPAVPSLITGAEKLIFGILGGGWNCWKLPCWGGGEDMPGAPPTPGGGPSNRVSVTLQKLCSCSRVASYPCLALPAAPGTLHSWVADRRSCTLRETKLRDAALAWQYLTLRSKSQRSSYQGLMSREVRVARKGRQEVRKSEGRGAKPVVKLKIQEILISDCSSTTPSLTSIS